MSVHPRMLSFRGVALILAVAPAWKAFEWATQAGPRRVEASASRAGEVLFRHEWTPGDSLASGDGLGPVFNARSCVECHSQGGAGGGGPVEKNVTVYGIVPFVVCGNSPPPPPAGLPKAGVVHQDAVRREWRESLNYVSSSLPDRPNLPLGDILSGGGTRVPGVVISQRNTPALFGDGLIDAVTDDAIVAHERENSAAGRLVSRGGSRDPKIRGRVARLVDGRIGRFGWQGEFATLDDFVKAACANEIGLSNPDRAQPHPMGHPELTGLGSEGFDLTEAQCLLLGDYLRALPRPIEATPVGEEARAEVESGRAQFAKIGCADCHSPRLGPVDGLYSDLLLHDMGVELESSPGAYGAPPVPSPQFAADARPKAAEWRTPPLWGVADSAPYLHDGRAPTLEESILKHGGEAQGVAGAFGKLSSKDQGAIIEFLKTLKAPPATRGAILTNSP